MKSNHIFLLLILVGLVYAGCDRTGDPPINPYDSVEYGDDTVEPYAPDPTTIVGIYENVLQVYCDNPGCHDGSFEPDFRSIQSSWSTLVFHDLNKNTADSAYDFRVLPGDADNSMLIRRITQGDAALQQMPATGQVVPAAQVENIRTWINNGALDMFGNSGTLPNNEPQILGYVAYNTTFTLRYDETENRVDSLLTNPFQVPTGTDMNLVFLLEDDSTELQNLQVNQLRLSQDMNDFSGSTNINANFVSFGGFDIWVAPVNTGNFAVGDTLFMRYYVNDGDHTFDSEFPRDDLPDAYKTYAAFIVTP